MSNWGVVCQSSNAKCRSNTNTCSADVQKVAEPADRQFQYAHTSHLSEQHCTLCVPSRVSWVVLPQLFLAVSTNYLDRTALSFASLQMNADLQLSTQQYGLAAATFALGAYAHFCGRARTCQPPDNSFHFHVHKPYLPGVLPCTGRSLLIEAAAACKCTFQRLQVCTWAMAHVSLTACRVWDWPHSLCLHGHENWHPRLVCHHHHFLGRGGHVCSFGQGRTGLVLAASHPRLSRCALLACVAGLE